jgi:hypothetical protein
LRVAVVISEKLAAETLDNLGTMRKGNVRLEKLLTEAGEISGTQSKGNVSR